MGISVPEGARLGPAILCDGSEVNSDVPLLADVGSTEDVIDGVIIGVCMELSDGFAVNVGPSSFILLVIVGDILGIELLLGLGYPQ